MINGIKKNIEKIKYVINYMDITNLGIGAGGTVITLIIVYLFKYLNTHKVKIISSCCSVDIEQDRTPKIGDVKVEEKLEDKKESTSKT